MLIHVSAQDLQRNLDAYSLNRKWAAGSLRSRLEEGCQPGAVPISDACRVYCLLGI